MVLQSVLPPNCHLIKMFDLIATDICPFSIFIVLWSFSNSPHAPRYIHSNYKEGIWAEWNGQNQKKTSISESGGGGLAGGQFVHFLPDSCSPQLQRPLKWWITSPWARCCGLSGRRRKVQIYIVIFKKSTGKITFCMIGWSFALVGSARLICSCQNGLQLIFNGDPIANAEAASLHWAGDFTRQKVHTHPDIHFVQIVQFGQH